MWVVEAFDDDGNYIDYSQEAFVSEEDARRYAEEQAQARSEYSWEVRYVTLQTSDPKRPYAEA